MAGVVFEDIFDVKDIDPGGKKFERGKWFGFFNRFEEETYSELASLLEIFYFLLSNQIKYLAS